MVQVLHLYKYNFIEKKNWPYILDKLLNLIILYH